ncbi:ABC transporter ATP-binding protein [Thalassoglobus sp.]|uniref:ABC transporter ATP-binding protein n=1 Tax=Thalassoglobus sp. TaxID=2795869 RepID=UPI003AA8DD63
MIEVSKFRKIYSGTVAVEQVDFLVQPGEILGLIGPNGAGKTTTLRSLCGLTVPTEGTLSICGFDIEKQPLEVKKRIAYIPDDPPLFPELTVEQHLAFTASVFSVADAKDKASELLQTFELTSKRTTRASDLSRGMRQKLAICCSYLHAPEVILLDEPMTGLDPHGIRKLKESLQQRAAQGTSVIISSHLLAMVEDICSTVLILKEGQQRFFGSIAELKSLFTASCDEATLEQIFFQATETEFCQSVPAEETKLATL